MPKEACLNQVSNNAENETESVMDFALPGVRKRPKPFIKLLKEAREAKLVPPSLPTPSYSWEKVECPDQDCMTLPARRPKEPKEGESNDLTSGDNSTRSNNAAEEPVKEENQPSSPKELPKPKEAPSLQAIIEKMQKCQEVERQLKARKEIQRAKQLAGTTQKAMTASQALKTAKVTAPIDYRERKRLRQEKEIEEARKELMEAARNALQDRIEFNKKERKSSQSSTTVGKTLFCGSTDAMFNPEAPIGENEEILSEESEENEAEKSDPQPEPTPQPSANPQPTILQTASEAQPSTVETKVKPNVEEALKDEKPAVEKTKEKKEKKLKKKTRKDKKNTLHAANATNIAPSLNTNVQMQPVGGSMLINPIQGCLMPQQVVMPMPFAMQQPQLSPWSYAQVCPSPYPFMGGQNYSHIPVERTVPSSHKYRKQRRRKQVKHCGDSSSSSSESISTTSSSISSSSLSDLSSFESGTTFSGNTEGSSTSTISSSIFPSDEDEETNSSETSSTDSSEYESSSSCPSSQSESSCYDSSSQESD